MSTVWQNLIDNAVKFTESRAKAHIQIGFETRFVQPTAASSQSADSQSIAQAEATPQEETVFFIKDNGIGFDPQQLERMFGMFQQAHGPNIESGLGIGLASVKRIVLRHQGSVWAEPNEAEGATFYFSLPVTPAIVSIS